MVVQHNLQAINSNRMLGITQGTLSGSTEKLSSGYKINRAADNAAGLAISEKMRKQIRGLTQASANAEDGISSVQTAEGALQEVTDMLQRMNELAVQAANGTNSVTDRQYIQDEIDQLITEIDRVSETTKFNETYLLKGDATKDTTKVYTMNFAVTYTQNLGSNAKGVGETTNTVSYKVDYVGKDNVYIVSSSITSTTKNSPMTADVISEGDDITKYLANAKVGTNASVSSVTINTQEYMAFTNAELKLTEKVKDASGKEVEQAVLTVSNGSIIAAKDAYFLDTETNEIIKIAAGEDLTDFLKNNVETDPVTSNDPKDPSKKITVENVTFAEVADKYRLLQTYSADPKNATDDVTLGGTTTWVADKEFKANESMQKLYDADGNEVSGVALNKYFDAKGTYKGGLYTNNQATTEVQAKKPLDKDGNVDTTSTVPIITDYITKNTAEVTQDLSFSLHVGADSARTNKITTNIQSMSAAALGINKLSSKAIGIVDESGDNATDAIDVISDALQKVSTQRSALGAVQNRLEHTIKNLDNVVENTTSAESAIRDTDMATEMVQYSNANILAQAGQSMLAQANQSNQGVLSLLG